MSVIALRPSGTTSNTGTVTGAATAHAALSDNTDSSYIALAAGQSANMSLDDLALPAGAVVKHVALRVRFAEAYKLEEPSDLRATVASDPGDKVGYKTVGGTVRAPSTLPSTIYVGGMVTGWTDLAVDAAELTVTVPAKGDMRMNVFEAYFDVTYVEQPVITVTEPAGVVSDTNMPVVRWEY